MNYQDVKRICHVRSAIRRKARPNIKFWKNHPGSLDNRVPRAWQQQTDWEEYDPREHEECSAFNETPA